MWNWCPLAFMSASGANLTPDKLPRGGRNTKMARDLSAACDEALAAAITALQPAHIVGFGAFAAKRAQLVINGMRAVVEEDSLASQAKSKPKLKTNANILSAFPNVLQVLHPSPASPAANRGWAPQIDRALAHLWSR
jgi:single-strand selective monofunctional uracil DNA glycosylase